MPKGPYTHLARIGLLLVALILLGLFACPPRGYAQALGREPSMLVEAFSRSGSGGRCRIRTCDFYRVRIALYR